MNAVEIEEAVSELAGRPFDPAEFPFAFLTAFGNKDTTIKRLRAGNTNASDIPGGVLQRNHIHIAVCPDGLVSKTIVALRESPKTAAAKAKFVLATDGISLEAEDLIGGEPIACAYGDFAKHFGFFLPLAGISTVKEIKNNPFDIKATGRLNKLYVELLKDNPDWATEAKRPALNQFIARLIFCFFAEDTGIFLPKQFTKTLEQMSDSQSGNTHEVLCELFRAMDLKPEDRTGAKVKSWADVFPYVNGGMFAGAAECPQFSRIARSYLLAVGNLEWDKINPDIFGSMIQAVADDDERSEIGMHYTSVPNILKVLNPLFLNDLREHLESAGDNLRKLRNLRRRLSAIRVFDPACGSGNFLVIAYKEMRAIENEIARRTGDEPRSWIKLENFYGIEIKNFAVEIARLALLIAEFQCDVQYISQQEARAMVLPLHRTGQIHAGNSLTLDWLSICPPTTSNSTIEKDLGGVTGRLALGDQGITDANFSETYICGNPPYAGSKRQSKEQKNDLKAVFEGRVEGYKILDYVSAWFMRGADYTQHCDATYAFVSTNSICQGEQVAVLWPHLLAKGNEIVFAHRSFQWRNLASNNAVVTCVIVGMRKGGSSSKKIFEGDISREVKNIGPYLVEMPNLIVERQSKPLNGLPAMSFGNHPYYGGALILESHEARELIANHPTVREWLRPLYGTDEFIEGRPRYCLWFDSDSYAKVGGVQEIRQRVEAVRLKRLEAENDSAAQKLALTPFRFRDQKVAKHHLFIVARHSSESRDYLPVELLDHTAIVSDAAFAIFDAPMWVASLIASRIHLVWISTVCGKLETRYRYSNTLGWNTFPIPSLTEQNKRDLSRSGEQLFLTRAEGFPANLGDLYDDLPPDLKRVHDQNDELVERIYVGRRFRNDTERLEKLFEMYIKTFSEKPLPKRKAKRVA